VSHPFDRVSPRARLRLAANLSLLYAERPFLERFRAAAACGFTAVECQFPYDHPPAAIAAELRRHGLRLVLHNLPAGDWTAGERGIACHPERVAEFRAGIAQALAYAAALGVPQLNVIAGVPPAGVTREQALDTLVDNLRAAAHACARAGIGLRLEPINSLDIPGFLVDTVEVALAVLARVAHPGLRLQFDAYHVARMGQDPLAVWQRCYPHVGHVQWADCPGRHEPGTGTVDWAALADAMIASGWDGWIGAEYLPADAAAGGTEAGLGWIECLGLRRRAADLQKADR